MQTRCFSQLSVTAVLSNRQFLGEFSDQQGRVSGNFGLGVYDHLEGELLAIDGNFYQLDGNCSAKIADKNLKIVIANLIHFEKDNEFEIKEDAGILSSSSFYKQLNSYLPSQHYFYGIRVAGKFENIRLRGSDRQIPPFKSIEEIAKNSRLVDLADIEGVMIGFYVPEYMKSLNTPGYHFHWISKDRKMGGHVIDFSCRSMMIQTCQLTDFSLQLPQSANFKKACLREEFSFSKIDNK